MQAVSLQPASVHYQTGETGTLTCTKDVASLDEISTQITEPAQMSNQRPDRIYSLSTSVPVHFVSEGRHTRFTSITNVRRSPLLLLALSERSNAGCKLYDISRGISSSRQLCGVTVERGRQSKEAEGRERGTDLYSVAVNPSSSNWRLVLSSIFAGLSIPCKVSLMPRTMSRVESATTGQDWTGGESGMEDALSFWRLMTRPTRSELSTCRMMLMARCVARAEAAWEDEYGETDRE